MFKSLLVAVLRVSPALLVAGCVSISLIGCASHKPGTAPWDPQDGRALFEQLPAWDGAAGRICGGHLKPEEARRRGLSQRC
jgi:hypothetical protein